MTDFQNLRTILLLAALVVVELYLALAERLDWFEGARAVLAGKQAQILWVENDAVEMQYEDH